MKKDTSDFFEEDIMENKLAEALEQEQTALLEIELEKENKTGAPEIPEASTRKKLKRELEREALSRLEDAARMEEDFQNVVTWWNRLDAVFNCPFEMHELVTDADISRSIFALKDVQKELLYQLAIRGYSCQMIASFRKQTDRNIHKIRNVMLRKL